jgi:N-acyl-D-amino-acid deacylase
MGHEIVIRGGSVVDGSGGKAFQADVGIQGGRIAEVGRITARGEREIDAEGHVVSPGFIDGHTHYDAQVNWDPLGTSSCWHGVTSVVMGNCGFTLAPVKPGEEALVVRNLERAEDISAAAMAQGIDWKWSTFPEYLDALEALPKGINFASYVGHSALRTWAMGERAFTETASDDDLARMQAQLLAAVKAGAMGLSTSRSTAHETSDDRKVPSRVASWDEVRALVGAMGRAGRGVFELANEVAPRSIDPAVRAAGQRVLLDLALESRVPMTFGIPRLAGAAAGDTTFLLDTPREVWRDFLKLLDTAAAAGGTIFGQSSCKDVIVLLSFRTQLPFDRLPVWKDLRAKPLDEQARLLRDPAMRAQLVDIAHNGPYGRAIGNEARKPNWDLMQVYDKPLPPYRTVASLAAERGTDPVSLMIDLSLESDFNAFFMQSAVTPDEEGILEIVRHPRTVMTFSDSGAHVGQIADSSIQTYLLASWVRERQALTLEHAVNMMTHRIARYWGFADRGLIREGMAADINVFDAARIAPTMPEVVYDIPGGARRIVQRAEGIRATLVAGRVVLDQGEHTGELPGRVLRSAA